MKKQLLWAALTIAVTTSIPLAAIKPVYSAIPPLSEQKLQSLSHYIVIGTVISDQNKEIPAHYGTIFAHTATIQVESLEKTRSGKDAVKPGQTIEVRYARRGKTDGRPGSQRQSEPLKVGMKVKLFLVKGEDGFSLLEPNGWQPYPAPVKSPMLEPEPTDQLPLDEQLKRSGFEPEATRSFLSQLRIAADRRNAQDLVSRVRFPFTLYDLGKPLITYHQPEALLRDFPLVFTEPVLQDIKQVDQTKLFVNGDGAMIGNGTVWFDQRQDGIKIIAINSDRSPLKLKCPTKFRPAKPKPSPKDSICG